MNIRFYLLLITSALIGISCNRAEKDTGNINIATWKNVTVDSLVFKSQYVRYVSTASVYDSPKTRKEFARQLIERRIVADQASKLKIDTLPSVRNEIFRAREISLAKYYIRSKVEPKIAQPSEKEIRNAFQRANTQVHLQQIFAPNKEQIEKYRNQLSENPNLFTTLAENSMISAGELPESYKMGWVEWNTMDLEPEKRAFSLKTGQISEPVESLIGWHIFKAVDRKETSYADNTSFQNAKEAIAQTIERRHFEEASVKYIDSVLSVTELAMYPENTRLLWNYLAPKLPGNKNEIQAVLINESNIYNGKEIPSNLTLAVLNGKPFTVEDFMKRLPNIPFWQLQPNMRPALETVLKDKLFAEKATKEGFENHPQVLKEMDIAKTSALNTVYISTVSDTLDLEGLAPNWYNKRKNNFIRTNQRIVEFYSFDSEHLAQSALEQFKIVKDWAIALQDYKNDFQVSTDTLSSENAPDHPVFQINLDPEKYGDFLLWGPYRINESWSYIRITSSSNTYFAIEESKDKLLSLMKRERNLVAREYILQQADYSTSKIIYNEDLLKSILPFYF